MIDLTQTKTLKPGANALGALLGNYKFGYLDVWCNMTAAGETFGQPGGACQTLKLMAVANFTDGTSITTGSDLSWKARNGPITYDHLWHGEIYDANKEVEDWASAGLPSLMDSQSLTVSGSAPGWSAAVGMSPLVGVMSPQLMQPIRIVQSFEPISINTTEVHTYTPGCENGFAGGRFIRCPTCTGNAGQPEAAAVYFQSCSNELSHLTAGEDTKGWCSSLLSPGIELVAPGVMAGWAARYKGALDCTTGMTANKTDALTIVDFGQNMAGFTTLKISGDKGTTITLQHTENIGQQEAGIPHNSYYPGDGAHMTKNNGKGGTGVDPSGAHVASTCGMTASRSGGAPGSGWYEHGWFECANQTDSYTFKGGAAVETYTPSFTYHGFRYVAVRGLPAGFKFSKEMLTAHFCHSDLPRVASLTLPEVAAANDGTPDILNEIYHITLCAQMSQLWSIPTDCPQREKRGWMGDAHMSSSGLMFSMDAQSFHTNFLQNINDDQVKSCVHNPDDPFIHPCTGAAVALGAGAVPDVSPFQTSPYGSNPGSVVWQSAYPVIAFNMWRHYGDKAVLKTHWSSLVSFMDYIERVSDPKTHLTLTGGLSDWVPPGGNGHGPVTDARECSAFYALLDTKHMADMAIAIGESSDAAKYTAMYEAGGKAYHEHFYNATTKVYGKGSQCSCVMALHIGAVPKELEASVVKTMVDDIQVGNKYGPNHIDVGIIGTTFIFDTLTKYGRADVAIATLLNDTYPSFGYMVSQGATTLWEAWEGTHTEQTSSWNHIMFGGNIHTWVYSTLAGIDTAVNGTTGGWETIIFRPAAAAMLTLGSASMTIETRFGNATIDWSLSKGGGSLTMTCTVPAGSMAEIHIPMLPQLGGSNIAITDGAKVRFAAVFCTVFTLFCTEKECRKAKSVWKAGAFVAGSTGVTGGSVKVCALRNHDFLLRNDDLYCKMMYMYVSIK